MEDEEIRSLTQEYLDGTLLEEYEYRGLLEYMEPKVSRLTQPDLAQKFPCFSLYPL